jgi:enoyl-CoA hydratase/carnithine racemase
VPDSIFHIYAFWLGQANAYRFLMEGKLMRSEEALQVGLVDELVDGKVLLTTAERKMKQYLGFDRTTWQQSKQNLRKELIGKVQADQTDTLEVMLKQWWSPSTRSILHTIIQNLQKK